MSLKTKLSFLIYSTSLCAGVYIAMNSWNGTIYWFNSDSRNPAAIKKVFDFSHLEGRALEMASHKRLVADAVVYESKEAVGLELGHFVTKTPAGNKKFACEYYKTVELTFYSADMSVSGDPSVMKLTTDCKAAEDQNRIATIWVPFKEIFKNPLGDFELKLTAPQQMTLNFKNIGDRWPQAWTLSGVKMIPGDSLHDELLLGQRAIYQIIDRPITLVWLGNF